MVKMLGWMRKKQGALAILCGYVLGVGYPVWAGGIWEAAKISESAVLVQAKRQQLIAQNVANATTVRMPDGKPYRQLEAVIASRPDGTIYISRIDKRKTPFKRVFDPANPYADSEGFVELPNVDLSEEMVNLSYTNMLYDANVTAYKSAKYMYQQVIDILK